MKKKMLTVALVMSANVLFGQKVKETAVPVAVKNAFHTKYATATETSWEKEDGMYEVHFELNEVDYSVLYTTEGVVFETEQEIEISDYPAGVVEYVGKNYPKKKITEAGKITDANGVVTYEAEVSKKDLIFDAQGKFLKKM